MTKESSMTVQGKEQSMTDRMPIAMPRFDMPRFVITLWGMPKFAMPRFAITLWGMPKFDMPRFAITLWGMGEA